MAKRTRIAVLVGQADENYQHKFIEGFTEQAFKQNYDVCIFSMFKKYQNTSERELGEGNIYNLINYDLFDAIIFMKDTIQTPGLAAKLENTIHEKFNGPVLCIDIESKFFPTIWTDGYTPVRSLVDHLIEHHNYKDIAVLTGKKWHIHSKTRYKAYKDSMEAHGLTVREDRVFYGDFWYTSGNMCAEYLLKHPDDLPEAVVCANDCMAIGLCEALTSAGLKIPDDIAVVGFDSIPEAETSPVPITSAFIPARECGSNSAIAIKQLLNGEEINTPSATPSLFIGGSCGCPINTEFVGKLRNSWATEISKESFYSLHNSMAEDLLSQSELEGTLDNIYSYTYQIRPFKSLHICLTDQWLNPGTLTYAKLFSKGYSKKMLYAIHIQSEDEHEDQISTTDTFDTSIMLPELDEERTEPHSYIFTPLFFESSCLGYVVIDYGKECRSYDDTFRLWVNQVSRGLECVRRMENIRALRDGKLVTDGNKFAEIFADSAKLAAEIKKLSPDERDDFDEVQKILDNNLLVYHFQPIISAKTGEIYAYEALMRSNSKRYISPLQILKYAGMVGRLPDVEKATFLNVLSITENNKQLFSGKYVFINSIPGITLMPDDEALIENRLLNHKGLTVVELTEQAELSDDELNLLKSKFIEMGIGLAVDDYGTGYSNITNLLRYMPDYVKIDRALLSGIQDNAQKQHFVREIIEFSHNNSILALAEGIETSEELRTVILLGVDLIQGYYTAKPAREIIQEIDSLKKSEIEHYYTERIEGSGGKVYIAGKTNRVSLNNLQRDGYSKILIGGEATYRDISLIGSPGLSTKIHLVIKEDYEGQITLDNANFSNVKGRPCIELRSGCKVSLLLRGDNHLHNGGILVSEGSSLVLEGDGNLDITLNNRDYYGIGNAAEEKHGNITCMQDGIITIVANGDNGVAIGSGLGGNISLDRGKYLIRLNGNFGIGVGSFSGDHILNIFACDFETDLSLFSGVAIGSISGSVDVNVHHCMLNCHVSGEEIIGIGSLRGEKVSFTEDNASVAIDTRGTRSSGIATFTGETELHVKQASLRIVSEGKEALAYGGYNNKTLAILDNSDSFFDIKSENRYETMADDENIKVINGRIRVFVNRVEVQRKITDGDF